MRLRHIPGCEQIVAESPSVVHDPMQYKGHWQEFFGNDRPIELEIGMGKGQFIRKLSLRDPEINFLGLERYETVLMKAIKRKELRFGRAADQPQLIRFAGADIRAVVDRTLALPFDMHLAEDQPCAAAADFPAFYEDL